MEPRPDDDLHPEPCRMRNSQPDFPRHDRCHQNGLRFAAVVFDGHAGGWGDSARHLVTWISHRLSLPPSSHRPLLYCFSSFRGLGLPRHPFLRVAPLLCRGLALSLGPDQLFDMGSMSPCSSPRTPWTSGSDLPREKNIWNDALNAAYHHETGKILRAFWGWNGATTHSADVGVACLSFWSETDPERHGDGGVRKRGGSCIDNKEPCAPDVLMLRSGWCHPFGKMQSVPVLSFDFTDTHVPDFSQTDTSGLPGSNLVDVITNRSGTL